MLGRTAAVPSSILRVSSLPRFSWRFLLQENHGGEETKGVPKGPLVPLCPGMHARWHNMCPLYACTPVTARHGLISACRPGTVFGVSIAVPICRALPWERRKKKKSLPHTRIIRNPGGGGGLTTGLAVRWQQSRPGAAPPNS